MFVAPAGPVGSQGIFFLGGGCCFGGCVCEAIFPISRPRDRFPGRSSGKPGMQTVQSEVLGFEGEEAKRVAKSDSSVVRPGLRGMTRCFVYAPCMHTKTKQQYDFLPTLNRGLPPRYTYPMRRSDDPRESRCLISQRSHALTYIITQADLGRILHHHCNPSELAASQDPTSRYPAIFRTRSTTGGLGNKPMRYNSLPICI